jgi:hypothetical protein
MLLPVVKVMTMTVIITHQGNLYCVVYNKPFVSANGNIVSLYNFIYSFHLAFLVVPNTAVILVADAPINEHVGYALIM